MISEPMFLYNNFSKNVYDFLHWGYTKDTVYVPSLPQKYELKNRITDSINSITSDMLQNVYEEFDYRLDVCRIVRGVHIEHL